VHVHRGINGTVLRNHDRLATERGGGTHAPHDNNRKPGTVQVDRLAEYRQLTIAAADAAHAPAT
jgi:hypothetical protein